MSNDKEQPAPLKTYAPGKLVFRGESSMVTLNVPAPREPLLSFFVNDEGKVEAKYEPENLTKAAQALLMEVGRLQGPNTVSIKQ